MTTAVIGFDRATEIFAEILVRYLGTDLASEGRILRDIYGRLNFITPRREAAGHIEVQAAIRREGIGTWCAAEPVTSLVEDLLRFEQYTAETSVLVHAGIRLIDRRVAGDDWLVRPVQLVSDPPRLVFYSVKGGVGRSTGLAVAAADLAARGHDVLVLDLDLEAPGIGTLLLNKQDVPSFGIIDWLAGAGAGADAEGMVPDMIGPSAFTSGRAVVDVVPAAGADPGAYLSKLARAYMPGSAGTTFRGFGFPQKIDALIRQLTARRHYDAVLIDARAGLHETSGGLVLGLGARVLLFGTDTPQTFEDFRLLFSAFAQAFDPALVGEDLRSAFKMVHAKAPRDDSDRQPFRERSWEIWSEALYDNQEPDDGSVDDAFVFDLGDDEAPHYPLEIIGDDSYARFNPRSQDYPLSASAYEPVFGRFLAGVRAMLGWP